MAHNERLVTDGVYWIGGNDRRLSVFEGVYPSERGVSYNSYLAFDEKNVVLDTVDKAVAGVFFENLDYLLKGKSPDYVVIHHMEPDHSACLSELLFRYPDLVVVTTQKSAVMIGQFFNFAARDTARIKIVKEGDTLCTGKRTYTFVEAPMVHWPEVMVSYESYDRILYSADAFGSFGAIDGNLFADEVDYEGVWLDDARRYYTNIVGKYGAQVLAALDKAAKLDIGMICPLHGLVWRKNLNFFLEKYRRWASCTPEDNTVLIVYSSVYGNTENAVNILSAALADRGLKKITVYDVSATRSDVIVSEVFRCGHVVFAATTYNAGIFIKMEEVLHDIKAHQIRDRTAALVENGSWAPVSGQLMRDMVSAFPGWRILGYTVTINSSLKETGRSSIENLADAIAADIPRVQAPVHEKNAVDIPAFFKLSYGLFLLTTRDGDKDNGCIINTAVQLTDLPKRITISVIKANYTDEIIRKTGIFNVSVLSVDTPFTVFRRFGFQSGRTVDKFADPLEPRGGGPARSANGLIYAPVYGNAFISARVVDSRDWGTHTLYTAEVSEAAVLSAAPSLTYQYYADHIKPKPPAAAAKKKGWVCKVCGYIHEGEELPPDFICPLCKHGVDAFEKLG
ncbi:MAG: flavin reductase [Treponema sp.]|jgi:flavorubredoxin/flavin reductase (DIM6/NTAB) family NADH-FMN oxidoreductase RutF/rubredoxin|nr:flavin reductase [Treponema sp.]